MAQLDFENLLKQTIGLDSATVGSATIEGAVRLRMTTLGIGDEEHYWDRLNQSEDELQELIEAVVVPETWFFRDAEAFSMLARLVQKDWMLNHPGSVLRLLSGPCCTGEEPYSMVMALLDAGVPRELIEVDAVDISLRSLTHARLGVYGQNSFRGASLAFRDQYFEKVDKGYRLPAWFRSIVNFRQANLLSMEFGAGVNPYDVIFCRNVLIYFDQHTQQRVLKSLGNLLNSDGYLFVGPAEAFLAASNGFMSVNQSMAFGFRKDGSPPPAPIALTPPRPIKAAKISSKNRVNKEPKVLPAPLPPAPQREALTDFLKSAKLLADAGRLGEAAELCETQLKQNGTSFEAYYLLGLVKDSMGDWNAAAQCYRKALYLDPKHYETMVHLALLSERMGDTATAEQLHGRARRVAKEAAK